MTGRRRFGLGALVVAALALGAAGCSSDGSAAAPTTSTTTTTEAATTEATTTSSATTTSLPSGAPMPGCEQGWTTPEPGSDDALHPLELILGQMGVEGELEVLELRMFAGPEVPWILEPRPDHVDWWYVKARLAEDPSFAGRWIVARRAEDRQGIDAVAPFDTRNYESPDWRAFEGDGTPRAIEGLPGEWGGVEYDFVVGDGGSTPGLPDEVERCLEGT